jgi:hypothetical protein
MRVGITGRSGTEIGAACRSGAFPLRNLPKMPVRAVALSVLDCFGAGGRRTSFPNRAGHGRTHAMNFFGLFRKSRQPSSPLKVEATRAPGPPRLPEPAPEPGAVRRLLFDAAAAGDDHKLECLCREHQTFILQNAHGWLEIPDEFRASPQVYEWYGNGLRAIAQFCAEKLGHDDLIARLPTASRGSHVPPA